MNALIYVLLAVATTSAVAPDSTWPEPVATSDVAGPDSTRVPVATPADLKADIDRVLRTSAGRNDEWGVLIVSLTHGDTLYSLRPDESFTPASNMKLFTTATALYYLGPRFRYNTFLLADGPIVDGVLQGDLVLYGTGDPTFSERFGGRTEVFEAFADTLAAHGVVEITGDIVGDASYFQGPGTGEGWQRNYIDASYAAPASALSFAENIATIRITPAARAGWRPNVELVPGGEGIAIVNQATTVSNGRTSIRAGRTEYGGPLTVRGRISSRSRGVLRSVPVSDPPRYAAAVLREVLVERGILVGGGVRAVDTEDASPVTGRSVFAPAFDRRQPLRVLAVHESPPLFDILEVVNKRSHNLYAEQTLRTIGRVATGAGDVAGGARAVKHFIATEAGIDTTSIHIFDGSGLSPLNEVTPRAIIQLLDYMSRSPMAEDYFDTLPEAGATDGLRRMQRTAAAGNLRAKTGTLSRVSALSGYVRAANGEQLAFSILANDVGSTWRAKRVEDEIGARLARFTRTDPGD